MPPPPSGSNPTFGTLGLAAAMMRSGSAVQTNGLGLVVVLGEVAVDGGLKVDQRMEHAALEPTPGQPGEEALDGVEPGRRGRGEVEGPARVALEPGADLGVLVAGVVVEDHVDELAGRDRRARGG